MRLQATDEFRAAVRFGHFSAAERLLGELRREVELSWAAADPDERQRLAVQVLDLLEWARQSVLVGRSHTQRKLTHLRRDGAYASAAAQGRGRIEFEG
jgi:hypothetical protein